MTKYKLVISPGVYDDIRNAVEWYDKQQKGLGSKFYAQLTNEFRLLMKNPHFQLRYSNIRCFPVKKFPFLIHLHVNDKEGIVYIEAIIHTSQNSENWPTK